MNRTIDPTIYRYLALAVGPACPSCLSPRGLSRAVASGQPARTAAQGSEGPCFMTQSGGNSVISCDLASEVIQPHFGQIPLLAAVTQFSSGLSRVSAD